MKLKIIWKDLLLTYNWKYFCAKMFWNLVESIAWFLKTQFRSYFTSYIEICWNPMLFVCPIPIAMFFPSCRRYIVKWFLLKSFLKIKCEFFMITQVTRCYLRPYYEPIEWKHSFKSPRTQRGTNSVSLLKLMAQPMKIALIKLSWKQTYCKILILLSSWILSFTSSFNIFGWSFESAIFLWGPSPTVNFNFSPWYDWKIIHFEKFSVLDKIFKRQSSEIAGKILNISFYIFSFMSINSYGIWFIKK